VSPSEIEDVLAKHPLVAEACVIAVPEPNGGDLMAKAFVVLNDPLAKVTPEELKEFSNCKSVTSVCKC
jgi:acyl-coenzyme A synthetase/AMP-(fatty) acid ligase